MSLIINIFDFRDSLTVLSPVPRQNNKRTLSTLTKNSCTANSFRIPPAPHGAHRPADGGETSEGMRTTASRWKVANEYKPHAEL